MKNNEDTKLIKNITTIHIANGRIMNFIFGTINMVNNETMAKIRESKEDAYLLGRPSI
jgi:hypothetical protein